MPEITREEARDGLLARLANIERWLADADPDAPDDHAHYEQMRETAAIYRLALAALEDAERVDALAYDLEGGPIFDQYGERDVHMIAATDAHIETDERGAYCRAVRAAIDRARG